MKDKLKNKKVIVGLGVCVTLIVITTIVVMNQSVPLKIKDKEIVLEYGQQFNLNPKEYLNEDQKVIDKTTVSIREDIVMEEGKDYYPVGEYTLVLSYEKESAEVKVIVKDTTAPVFKEFKDVQEIVKGTKIDYTKLYTAEDLSSVQITVDDSKVKYDTIGEYKVIIKAVDISENEVSKTITVKVKEEKKDIVDSSQNKAIKQIPQSSKATNNKPSVQNSDYVKIKDYISSMHIDLKYATNQNFTGQVIYDFNDAYLRYGTVKKLAKVQEELLNQGYSLKIWDAYRPFEAQKKLWKVVNDSRYVADPAKGPRSHNLGVTVDITIVKKNGDQIAMPTEFDDFSKKADRNYSEISNQEAVDNVKLLENTMYKYGFTGYKNEWWDYTDTASYPYVDFQPK